MVALSAAGLIGAGAAHAEPGPGVVVLSPDDGAVVSARPVTFEGTGASGATVGLFDADGGRIAGTDDAVVADDGRWKIEAEFPADAAGQLSVFALQSIDGVVDSSDDVTFFLVESPILPEPLPGVAVLSPADGETVSSRSVTFEGTATSGATVGLFDDEGERIPGTQDVAVADDGRWQIAVEFASDAAEDQTVIAYESIDGVRIRWDQVTFSLPEPAPEVAVLNPADGETVASRSVTFEGTGASGATVELFDADGDRIAGTADAIVADDGRWEIAAQFPPDAPIDQTVVAVQSIDGVVHSTDDVALLLPEPAPGPDPEPGPGPVPDPEPDPEPAPDLGPEPAPDAEPAPGAGPETGPEAAPESGPAPESGTDRVADAGDQLAVTGGGSPAVGAISAGVVLLGLGCVLAAARLTSRHLR